eukprot:4920635-Pyramimonas_sp.AAC.1
MLGATVWMLGATVWMLGAHLHAVRAPRQVYWVGGLRPGLVREDLHPQFNQGGGQEGVRRGSGGGQEGVGPVPSGLHPVYTCFYPVHTNRTSSEGAVWGQESRIFRS